MKNDQFCSKAWLCNFTVTGDYPEAQVEVCEVCGKKVIYGKEIKAFYKDEKGETVIKRGQGIDNAKYLQDHRRDFVQPYGRTLKDFLQLYGHNMETIKEVIQDWSKAEDAKQMKGYDDMMRDAKQFMKHQK